MATSGKEYWVIKCDQCGKEEKQEKAPNSFLFGGWFKLEKRINGFYDEIRELDLCSKECVHKAVQSL